MPWLFLCCRCSPRLARSLKVNKSCEECRSLTLGSSNRPGDEIRPGHAGQNVPLIPGGTALSWSSGTRPDAVGVLRPLQACSMRCTRSQSWRGSASAWRSALSCRLSAAYSVTSGSPSSVRERGAALQRGQRLGQRGRQRVRCVQRGQPVLQAMQPQTERSCHRQVRAGVTAGQAVFHTAVGGAGRGQPERDAPHRRRPELARGPGLGVGCASGGQTNGRRVPAARAARRRRRCRPAG